MALLAQLGATSSRSQGGIEIVINETSFPIELIRKKFREFAKKNLRRVAKDFATEFFIISKNHNYKANLLNKITLFYSDFKLKNEDDRYWVSDYQSENEDCPSYIREQLAIYYKEHIQTKNENKKKIKQLLFFLFLQRDRFTSKI